MIHRRNSTVVLAAARWNRFCPATWPRASDGSPWAAGSCTGWEGSPAAPADACSTDAARRWTANGEELFPAGFPAGDRRSSAERSRLLGGPDHQRGRLPGNSLRHGRRRRALWCRGGSERGRGGALPVVAEEGGAFRSPQRETKDRRRARRGCRLRGVGCE